MRSFPQNCDTREKWIKATNRKNWKPTKYSKICSSHFREVDIDRTSLSCVRIREGAVPSIFPAFPKQSQSSQDQKSAAGSSKRPVGGDGGKKQKKRKTIQNEESDGDVPESYLQGDPFEMIEIEEPNIKQEMFDIAEFDEMNSTAALPDDGPDKGKAHFETVYCSPAIIKEEHQDFETPSSNNATEIDTLVPEFEHRQIKIEPRDEEEEEDEDEEVVTESLHTRLMWRCPLVSCPEMFSTEMEMYQHLNLNHVVKGDALSSKSKKGSGLRSERIAPTSTIRELLPTITSPTSPSAAGFSSSVLVFTTTSPRVSPITVTSTVVPTCQSVPSSSSGPVTVTTTFSYSSLTTPSAPRVTAVSSSSITSSIKLISSASSSVPVISSSIDPSSASSTSYPPASSPTLVSTITSSHSPPPSADATTITNSATSHSPDSHPLTTDSQGLKKIVLAPLSDQDFGPTSPKKNLLTTQKPQLNDEARTSITPLQIFEPSEPIIEDLLPCATDKSEIFSVSLARFPEDSRIPIKRKLINVVECIRQKNIPPEKLLIAYYDDSSDSRTM